MKILVCAILVFAGCSAKAPVTCVSESNEKRGVLGEERSTKCSCSCPPTSTNVVEAGGIVGGLLSLFDKE